MAAWPPWACWRGSRPANTSTICRCTGSSRSRPARACRWRARPWPSGSVASVWRCSRWPTGSPNCCGNRPACMPTRHRLRQLYPGSGKTRHAYLWAYRSGVHDAGPPIVVFDYQTSRAGAHARAFLHGWRGHLMVDDYVGYKALFTDGPTELACLAHIRRKFFDVHAASGSPAAEEALRRIAALYAIEQQGAGLDPPQRLALRQRLSVPALDDLHAWLLKIGRTIATGSSTAKAIDHALKRWPALARYADSGSLPIDNNPVENAIRPIAIGKNNANDSLMRIRRRSRAISPSVETPPDLSAISHDHSDCRNCINPLGGR